MEDILHHVGFEVFTAVTMKTAFFILHHGSDLLMMILSFDVAWGGCTP
jgi:hypothetical protein